MARILVIDDEPGILDLLDTVLCHKGHEVVLAERGRAERGCNCSNRSDRM